MTMTRRTKLWVAGAAVVAVVGGVAAAYAVLALRTSDAPPEVALPSISGSPGSSGSQLNPEDFNGTWSLGEGSFVGYRVREKFTFLESPNDAVGRTTAVTGTLTIEGTTITEVSIEADLQQLESDEARRDERIRTDALETNTYPTATFTLTEPMDLGSVPEEDQEIQIDATGDLTIHDVTQSVTVSLDARWTSDGVQAAGKIPVVFADYDVIPPSGGPVSVSDEGTIELQLTFEKAAG
jgi:polyisoprenoid-binding protein YceI